VKLSEIIVEGFAGFTVSKSDSAFDLSLDVKDALLIAKSRLDDKYGSIAPKVVIDRELCKVAISALREGLRDKGNAYNTHGTLNVAMVINEKHKEFRKIKEWKQFAGEVCDLLKKELEGKFSSSSQDYMDAMSSLAKSLEEIAK